MSDMPQDDARAAQIDSELARLADAVEELNAQGVMRLYGSGWRVLGLQFARGLVFGLGTALGAGVLVSVLVYSLSKIQFVPVIGDFARDVIVEIEAARGSE